MRFQYLDLKGGSASLSYMLMFQAMLLQYEEDKIILFPAWPKDWDVDFKLHAPYNTTIEEIYRSGKPGC